MARSSPFRRYDSVYPIRLRLLMPENGLGDRTTIFREWFNGNVLPGGWREGASTVSPIGPVFVLYFRRIDDARAFLTAFPNETLADAVDHLGLDFTLGPSAWHKA